MDNRGGNGPVDIRLNKPVINHFSKIMKLNVLSNREDVNLLMLI